MSDTLVQDSARRLFADLVPPAVVNAAEDGSWPEGLWDAVADAGFADALAAGNEQPGDLAGLVDAAAILREAGRHAAPIPLAESMLARWLLAGAGIDAPQGPLTLANVERAGRFALRREGERWRIEGRAQGVPWAAEARGVVACAEHQVALIPRDALDIRPSKNLAGEPRDDIAFDVVVAAKHLDSIDAMAVYRLGALARSVMIAGALEEVLKLTVQYANDRVQFGRPIAKFQAIQQQLSVLAENVAAAGVVAGAAVEAAAREGAQHFSIATAKARCGEAAGKVAEIAHQVHGAIGFTHEHRLHHLTRRLWSWRDEFGVESEWQIELGHLAARKGGEGLWPLLTSW